MKFTTSLVAASALAANTTDLPLGLTHSANGGKPFFGITYNPNRYEAACQIPGDKSTFTGVDIAEDINLLSKYTNSVRTYALRCDYDKTILQEAAKLNMDVTFGLWVDEWSTFDEQLILLKKMLNETTVEDQKALKSLIIGNEAVFRGQQTTQDIADKINIVRAFLKEIGLERVTLTSAEIDRDYDDILIEAVDYLLPNLHIFFDNYDLSVAPGWYFHKYQKFSKLTSKPIIVGEVGWPSGGDPWDVNGSPSKSIPGVENAQFIMNSLLCEANRLGLPYYYFDAFDAIWKYGAQNSEFHWGVATFDRKVKDWVDTSIRCTTESYEFKKITACNGAPYDVKDFNCVNGILLCPNPLVGCGLTVESFSCYDQSKLSCTNGQLGPILGQGCNGNPFDDVNYTCTDDLFLCPKPLLGCGKSIEEYDCYDTKKATCSNGALIFI